LAKVQGNDKPVALVTGSVAPRVGRVVAEHLARRGYRLALHSHRPIPESQRQWHQPAMESDELLWLSGPVESEQDVEAWVGSIGDHFGRIDAVVTCAAIWDAAPLVETSVELMRRQWEVNVLGSFLIAKHFGLAMTRQEQGGGSGRTVPGPAGRDSRRFRSGSLLLDRTIVHHRPLPGARRWSTHSFRPCQRWPSAPRSSPWQLVLTSTWPEASKSHENTVSPILPFPVQGV